ncbi:MAG: thermonuclease family protein [Hyphomicrobium sp.]
MGICVLRLAPGAAIVFAATMAVAAAGTPEHSGTDGQCTLQAGPTRAVIRVLDAETVLLDDNQEVRLIGTLAPRSPDLNPGAQPWKAEEDATAALRALVLGRSVSLATSGRTRDRYGRTLAHLFVEQDGDRKWVQGELLASGQARVYGLPGSYACMRELLAHERVARQVSRGLWANAAYAVRSARRARELLRRRNSYEIIAGTAAKVAVTKARTYINFGTDWRSDFTAGIEARVLRANPEWAQTLAGLEGKRIEVRGWIQYRNGPYIDIEDPSQIAPAEEALPGRSPPPAGAMTSSDRDEDPTPPPPENEKRPAPKVPGALDL